MIFDAEKRLGMKKEIFNKYISLGYIEAKSDYKEDDLRCICTIHFLEELSFTSDEIKEYLSLIDIDDKDKMLKMLKKKRRTLLDDIHTKQKLLDKLDYIIYEKEKMNVTRDL